MNHQKRGEACLQLVAAKFDEFNCSPKSSGSTDLGAFITGMKLLCSWDDHPRKKPKVHAGPISRAKVSHVECKNYMMQNPLTRTNTTYQPTQPKSETPKLPATSASLLASFQRALRLERPPFHPPQRALHRGAALWAQTQLLRPHANAWFKRGGGSRFLLMFDLRGGRVVLSNNSEVLMIKSSYPGLHLGICCAAHVPALSVWQSRVQHL